MCDQERDLLLAILIMYFESEFTHFSSLIFWQFFFFFIFLFLETNLVCNKVFLMFSRKVFSLLFSSELTELPKREYEIHSQAYLRSSIHSPANSNF